MAEIEFSVLSRSCLRQRLPDEESLQREVGASVQGAKRGAGHHQLAVQDPGCPNQITPPLSLRFLT